MKSALCIARETIAIEQAAIAGLLDQIDNTFEQACDLILNCTGKLVVVGMGKSGHIGKKISATLASTGTPSFYIHPSEASHGDMGMIESSDVVLAISYSGETGELLQTLPTIQRIGAPIIALTAHKKSSLGRAAKHTICARVDQEACSLNLAPTASTTATLVMGDALAVALSTRRQFSSDDFALFHPGGSLGKQLLLTLGDLMHTGCALPTVLPHASLHDALLEMTSKRLGMTAVVGPDNELLGVFTDGDLRRSLTNELDLFNTPVRLEMTPNPVTAARATRATDALELMTTHQITTLAVTHNNQLIGIAHMHDILKHIPQGD